MEAVIAISGAKKKAKDESEVFWCYRGRALSKVNLTHARNFFDAFCQNGNVRYLPLSSPAAVIRDREGNEQVMVIYESISPENRPGELTCLTFPKDCVLALIGSDAPVAFLESLGIKQYRSIEQEEMFAVTPLFETEVKNVFLAGDILGSAYLETESFPVSDEKSTVRDRTRNFKRSMTDAALCVEGIRRRMNGIADGVILQEIQKILAEYAARHEERLAGEAPRKVEARKAAAPVGARFVRITEAPSGSQSVEVEDSRYYLEIGDSMIGRMEGDLCYPSDDRLRDRHARVIVQPDSVYVSIEGLEGQCMVRIGSERTLEEGDLIKAGQQMMRVKLVGDRLYLAVLNDAAEEVNLLQLFSPGRVYGRSKGKAPDRIVLNAGDRWLSRRHFRAELAGNVVKIQDFSTHGTFLVVTSALRLNPGDVLFVGRQRIRFDGLDGAATVLAPARPAPPPSPARPAAEKAVAEREELEAATAGLLALPRPAPAAAEPAVGVGRMLVIEPSEISVELNEGEIMLNRLDAEGLSTAEPSDADGKCLFKCREGTCGRCIVAVRRGLTNLFVDGDKKQRTMKKTLNAVLSDLRDQGVVTDDVQAEGFVLACLCSVKGPAQVRLLGNTDV